MRILICGHAALTAALARSPAPDRIACCASPGSAWPVLPVGALHLSFHDAESAGLGRSPPLEGHVRAFLSHMDGASALIACAAGLSRSPALAIVLAAARGADADAMCADLAAQCQHLQPNRLLLAYGDRLLGTDGALVRAASAAFPLRDRGVWGARGDAAPMMEIRIA